MGFSFAYSAGFPLGDQKIEGYVQIADGSVVVDYTLSGIAQAFPGQIGETIKTRLGSLLSDGEGSAKLYA